MGRIPLLTASLIFTAITAVRADFPSGFKAGRFFDCETSCPSLDSASDTNNIAVSSHTFINTRATNTEAPCGEIVAAIGYKYNVSLINTDNHAEIAAPADRKAPSISFNTFPQIGATPTKLNPYTVPHTSDMSLPADTAITMDAVRVKGAGPGNGTLSMTVVDSAAISQFSYGTLAELLAMQPGMFVKNSGTASLSTIAFRGTASSHTRITWNGIPVNNPMTGDADLSLLPVWFTDRAEIFHGGSSLATGSGALGGTVSTYSGPVRSAGTAVSVAQVVGSFLTRETFADVSSGGAKFRARVRYLYSASDNDFVYFNHALDPSRYARQQNAGYERQAASFDSELSSSRAGFFSMSVWGILNNRQLPVTMEYAGSPQRQKQNDDQIRGAFRWNFDRHQYRLNFTAGFSAATLDYHWQRGTVLAESSFSRTFSHNYILSGQWDVTRRTVLAFRAEAAVQNAAIRDRKAGTPMRDHHRTEAGLGISIHHTAARELTLFMLLHEQLSAGEFTPPLPSLGAEWTPRRIEGLSVRWNGAANYHFPTLNDLYWVPGGNPDLDPEKGLTTDLGVCYSGTANPGWSVSVTGYLSRIEDWIVWRYNPREGYYASPENISRVFARGTESSASGRFTIGRTAMSLAVNHTFTKTTNQRPESDRDRSKGKQLVYIPVHSGSVLAEIKYDHYYLRWMWSIVGERYTTSSHEAIRSVLPAYDLHDVSVGTRFEARRTVIDVRVRANNIFGRIYTALEYRPMPMQNFDLTVKLTFR